MDTRAATNVEIERKFQVGAWQPADGDSRTPIRQGYLSDAEAQTEIRVRSSGERTLMTVKQSGPDIDGVSVRTEVEFDVPPAVFDQLWNLAEGRRLEKGRYRVALNGVPADVDIYEGDLSGLRTVEVEFPDIDTARRFTPPAWFGPELTGDSRWSNRKLATQGRPA